MRFSVEVTSLSRVPWVAQVHDHVDAVGQVGYPGVPVAPVTKMRLAMDPDYAAARTGRTDRRSSLIDLMESVRYRVHGRTRPAGRMPLRRVLGSSGGVGDHRQH